MNRVNCHLGFALPTTHVVPLGEYGDHDIRELSEMPVLVGSKIDIWSSNQNGRLVGKNRRFIWLADQKSSRGQFHHPPWEESPNCGPERQSENGNQCSGSSQSWSEGRGVKINQPPRLVTADGGRYPCPRWPSWSASTPGAGVCSRAAAAGFAGDIGELGAPSAKVRTTIGSPPWRSKEKNTFALTTANLAAPISRPTMGRRARPSFWRIGLRFSSTLLPAIVD